MSGKYLERPEEEGYMSRTPSPERPSWVESDHQESMVSSEDVLFGVAVSAACTILPAMCLQPAALCLGFFSLFSAAFRRLDACAMDVCLRVRVC